MTDWIFSGDDGEDESDIQTLTEWYQEQEELLLRTLLARAIVAR